MAEMLLRFRQGKRWLHAARRRKQWRPGRLRREQGRREGTLDGEGMGLSEDQSEIKTIESEMQRLLIALVTSSQQEMKENMMAL